MLAQYRAAPSAPGTREICAVRLGADGERREQRHAGAARDQQRRVERALVDTPPYLHDGHCPALEDSVECFNLVLESRLTTDEKRDLVAYLRAL